MFLYIVFIIIGFFLLMKGADFLVDGASGIAKKFKIPTIIIGLTIVAIRNINARAYGKSVQRHWVDILICRLEMLWEVILQIYF